MNKLFVYGIFLSAHNRDRYGMSNPKYDVVPGYLTVSRWNDIVEAMPVDEPAIALTGLVVDVNPARWPDIDQLESGYDRKEITTINGVRAYMYVQKG